MNRHDMHNFDLMERKTSLKPKLENPYTKLNNFLYILKMKKSNHFISFTTFSVTTCFILIVAIHIIDYSMHKALLCP